VICADFVQKKILSMIKGLEGLSPAPSLPSANVAYEAIPSIRLGPSDDHMQYLTRYLSVDIKTKRRKFSKNLKKSKIKIGFVTLTVLLLWTDSFS